MLNWVTSQATFVIGVIALAFCYLMGLAAFATVELAARRGHRVALKAVSPVTLTPLAVVFGLLMAFLAADVWPNFDRARTFVGQEATQLSEVLVFADALRPEIRLLVRREIRDHVRNTVEREWPAMASGRATLRELPPPLVAALGSILAMNPEHAGQRLAQQHAVGAIEKALEARRQRILLSRMSVGGVKWLVLNGPRRPSPRHHRDDPRRQPIDDGRLAGDLRDRRRVQHAADPGLRSTVRDRRRPGRPRPPPGSSYRLMRRRIGSTRNVRVVAASAARIV